MTKPVTKETTQKRVRVRTERSTFSLLPLRDKIALVTGASSGIGRCIALSLAEEGAQVFLVGRRAKALEEVAKLAQGQSPLSRVCRTDLRREEDIYALAAEMRQNGGRLNILVHSSGEIHHAELATASIRDLDSQYQSNVRGPYLVTQALLPMLRAGLGQLVFINSSCGLRAPARTGQYAATQHAMKAIADSLREEVNADGIRILNVYLGRTATPRTERLFQEERKTYRPELLMQPEDVAAMIIHALKLPRTAEVTDISMRSLYKSY